MKYEVSLSLYINDCIDVEADTEEDAVEEAKEIFNNSLPYCSIWKDVEVDDVREVEE